MTVGLQVAEGEWVVTRVTGRGTHLGAWLGMRPTGKAVEITGVNIDRVVNGRIVEHGGVADLLGPLLAMGAIQWVAAENPFVKGDGQERRSVLPIQLGGSRLGASATTPRAAAPAPPGIQIGSTWEPGM